VSLCVSCAAHLLQRFVQLAREAYHKHEAIERIQNSKKRTLMEIGYSEITVDATFLGSCKLTKLDEITLAKLAHEAVAAQIK
jgi:hypothetical protein